MDPRQPASSPGSDNVETVKRIFDALARRDVDGALALIHRDVRVWVVTGAVARGGHPYVGHDGVRQYVEDAERLWDALELVPVEFDQVGDAVVVLGEVRARGPAGELRQPAVWTWKFTDRLVVHCRVDSDLRAAREALGLSATVEELLRGYVDAFNRRDADAMVAMADPAIVAYPCAITRSSRRYVGHQGLRNWIRDVSAAGHGYTVRPREVRKLENERWALLGELVDELPVSPFASLVRVGRGLITEAREYLSEESLLREVGHLPG